MLSDVIAEPFYMLQSCGVFLCGDDALRLWHVGKGFIDVLDVLLAKLVMVFEGQQFEVWRQWGEIVFHLLG